MLQIEIRFVILAGKWSNMTSLRMYIGLLIIAAVAANCEKDDPVIPNEEELITTVRYILTPNDGGPDRILRFQDVDGDGGSAPEISSDPLAANQTYMGTIELLNEQIVPAEDVTMEILEEDEDHQFFYESNVSGLMIAYDDQDANGYPVGLKSIITTSDPGTGQITITLRHQPNKGADEVSAGVITNAGGETDIEVTFTVDVL